MLPHAPIGDSNALGKAAIQHCADLALDVAALPEILRAPSGLQLQVAMRLTLYPNLSPEKGSECVVHGVDSTPMAMKVLLGSVAKHANWPSCCHHLMPPKNPMNHPSESSNDAVESVSTSLKVSDAWRLRPCLAELPELKPSAERLPGQGLDGAD